MHDIKVLEEEWIQYKKNKRKPYYIFSLLSIFFIGTLVYIFILDRDVTSHNFSEVKPINKMIVSKIDKPLINGRIETLELERKPSNPLVTNVDNLPINEKELIPMLPIVDDIPVIDMVGIKTKNKDTSVEKKITKKNIRRNIVKDKPHKPVHFKITKSSTASAYKEVEKRFNRFQDTDDSLFLAKSYYAKKEYKKAEYWALKTNKIDKNIEESWIIFVKSKIKLGHRKEAIHILSNYVRQSSSQEARVLLLKLKK